MKIKERIDFLRKELTEHNHSYYVLDTCTISDFEFDKLLKELVKLEDENQEYFDATSPTQRGPTPTRTTRATPNAASWRGRRPSAPTS